MFIINLYALLSQCLLTKFLHRSSVRSLLRLGWDVGRMFRCHDISSLQSYSGDPRKDGSDCQYHPGVPIFHEGGIYLTSWHTHKLSMYYGDLTTVLLPAFLTGLKFWSCCQRRTTDFQSFLNQEGCERGRHRWIKEEVTAMRRDKKEIRIRVGDKRRVFRSLCRKAMLRTR